MTKVLFIVKCRGIDYQQSEDTKYENGTYCMSSGLFNSASFVSHMLNKNGIESKIVQVVDNNSIDREVHRYKPTHVMIEALWVVPEKFEILRKLHPNVKWVIRLHSEIPFIANEGNSMGWIIDYLKQPNVYVAANTERMYDDVYDVISIANGSYIADTKVIYLPNYYEFNRSKPKPRNPNVIDIGCFGAIRPLKNQLIQAIAAIDFVRYSNKKLRFHINVGRIEQGNNAIKNIRALFKEIDSTKFELVEHDWLPHDKFINLIREMDLCLQVSFSETFNICTADAVAQRIPVVVSDEINWVSPLFYANPTSSEDIVRKISRALWFGRLGARFNSCGLKKYNKKSKKVWIKFLKRNKFINVDIT